MALYQNSYKRKQKMRKSLEAIVSETLNNSIKLAEKKAETNKNDNMVEADLSAYKKHISKKIENLATASDGALLLDLFEMDLSGESQEVIANQILLEIANIKSSDMKALARISLWKGILNG